MEEDFELDDTYSVSDGKLGGIDIPISGMKPISGTLTYEDNDLKSGCLTFDDYKVTYDGSKFTSEPGTCPIERAITYTDSNSVKYYNTEWIGSNPVYYNPTTGTSCTDYSESNSNTGNTVGCLKWYTYSEQNGNINLLLDHNTTAKLAWVSPTDYSSGIPELATSLGITYPDDSIVGSNEYGENGNWNKGPITLLKQLKKDTDGWNSLDNRNDIYTSINSLYGENKTNYTISYSGYKARLITAQEIAYITGNTSWDEKTSTNAFYFDSKTSSASPTCTEGNILECSYGWLYDRTSNSCETSGCLNNSDVQYSRYWTISPNAGNSYHAWCMYVDGRLDNRSTNYTYLYGVRPVITVPKSSIFES